MEYTLKVPANYIAVLKLFTGKNDKRYWINGVVVEVGAKGARLAATDGHVLGVFYVDGYTSDVPINVTIPNELLDNIKSKGDVYITIGEAEGEDLSRPVNLEQGNTAIKGYTIDRVFLNGAGLSRQTSAGWPHSSIPNIWLC